MRGCWILAQQDSAQPAPPSHHQAQSVLPVTFLLTDFLYCHCRLPLLILRNFKACKREHGKHNSEVAHKASFSFWGGGCSALFANKECSGYANEKQFLLGLFLISLCRAYFYLYSVINAQCFRAEQQTEPGVTLVTVSLQAATDSAASPLHKTSLTRAGGCSQETLEGQKLPSPTHSRSSRLELWAEFVY